MRTSPLTRIVAPRLAAVMLAIASSAAFASAMSGVSAEDFDEDAADKAEACSAIGCPNGDRQCGTATGTINGGVPPFVGQVKVSWTCYESSMVQ